MWILFGARVRGNIDLNLGISLERDQACGDNRSRGSHWQVPSDRVDFSSLPSRLVIRRVFKLQAFKLHMFFGRNLVEIPLLLRLSQFSELSQFNLVLLVYVVLWLLQRLKLSTVKASSTVQLSSGLDSCQRRSRCVKENQLSIQSTR